MISYRVLLYLLVATSPFINTSLIPGAKLPLSYLVVLLVLGLIALTRRIPIKIFGSEDFAFALFVFSGAVSVYINAIDWPVSNGVTQLINLVLTYFIYKVGHYLMIQSNQDPDSLLRNIFRYYSWVQIAALIFLVVGHFYSDFNVAFIYALNNAGNYDVGAIESVFPEIRLTGFSPEPSFWSFFVAMNISIGLSIRKPSPWLMMINGVSLLATVGRTGFLIMACILVLWFIRGNVFRIAMVTVAGVVALMLLRSYLDVQNLMAVDESFRQRIESMLVAVNVGYTNPLFGIGLGNFRVFAEQHHLDYTNIFNWYLSIFALSGMFGIISLGIFTFFLFRRIDQKYWLPVAAAFIGWLTVSAFNLPFVWVIFAALAYASTPRELNQQHYHHSNASS